MKKSFICTLALPLMILGSPSVLANDLDVDSIIQGLNIPKPANTGSGNKGAIAKIKGHKGNYFNAQDFNQAFRQGATKANDVELPLANGGKLKTLGGYQQTNVPGAQSAWEFTIQGWDEDLPPDSNGQIDIYKAPGAMANYGNRYEYVFYLPEISPRFIDKVDEALKKPKKNHSKIAKGVVVTFPRTENGQMYVQAVYEYTNKTSTGKLRNQISSLLLESRSLFNRYLSEARHAERKYMKEVRKSKPANLEKADFYQLMEDLSYLSLKKWDQPTEETEHGYAVFSFKGQNIRLWNHKDSFTVGIAMTMDKSLSDEQQKTLTSEWLEWGQKKLKKGAKNIEVKKNVYGDYEAWVLAVTFPLDGSLKGKDIEKYFDNIVREKRDDIANRYNKIKKKL